VFVSENESLSRTYRGGFFVETLLLFFLWYNAFQQYAVLPIRRRGEFVQEGLLPRYRPQSLAKEGWTITHDPYALQFGLHNLFIDLGAEQMLAAEREGQRIAVEIKSFIRRSEVEDLQHALGQYLLYRSLLQRIAQERDLYLAVPLDAFNGVFSSELGQVAREDYSVRLIVFDPIQEVIAQWVM
jgi:hypothetical protein